MGKDRKKADLKQWFEALPRSCLEAIESVSMDMWPAFINATLEMVPGAESKIAFDKFHVAKYLGEAVDKVRREEHRKLMKAGKADLKGTKYDWLSNPKNMTRRQKQRFKALRDSTLKTARAWAIKELAMRCPPWRAKRRRVVPGSREATRDTRRAEGAKGDPKGASERGVQSYGRPVCSRNELAMLWRNAG